MEYYPKSVSKKCTNKILEQMNKMEHLIYKIYKNQEKNTTLNFGLGIFCKIKRYKKYIPVLITRYQIIDEEYLENNKEIKISLDNKDKMVEFTDKYYTNKEYDLSIIEIKEKEENKINYLELDDSLYNEDDEDAIIYNKESIYIIHYDEKNEISVSYGTINYINNSSLTFSCNINPNTFSSPIFNLTNNKLLGLYTNNSKYYNKGVFFTFIINEFINTYKIKKANKKNKNILNEIEILLKVEEEDIILKKEIYFLDSINKQNIDNYYELNKLNTELYINNEKKEFKKFFEPKIFGEYTIKLKFDTSLTNCSYMFAGCYNIININFISFKTEDIIDMKYMFYGCTNLKTINNLTSFDTKNVINMSYMFCRCINLNNLNLFSFETSNVNNMCGMFYDCNNLNNLNLFSFNTSNVNNMSYMFSLCNNLNYLDLSSFNTKKVNNALGIFFGCSKKIIDLNLSYFKHFNKNDLIGKINNEIEITIKVDELNINKEIYFLDIGIIQYKEEKIYKDYNFKELNELNTELYINNKRELYKKYFNPKEKGEYKINLKFLNLTNCSYILLDVEI